MAEEQSMIGIVAAGLEHVKDVKVQKEIVLQYVGQTLQLEQQNTAMNSFIEDLVGKLREANIYTLLLKGQGIGQCYERPLWRACGDVDLFLNDDTFDRAKAVLSPLAKSVEKENHYTKHLGMFIAPFEVELHGSLRSNLTAKIDRELDSIKRDVFYGGNVRSWMNGKTKVFLLSKENDIVYVFSHILQHYFKGGVGLRQLCDWCRLLWTYKDAINPDLIDNRLRAMGVMSEWRAFAALAVNTLGMPVEAMPLYSDSPIWKKKSDRILSIILETGNFGHNRDLSYQHNCSMLKRKMITFRWVSKDAFRQLSIFPLDSIKIWCGMLRKGLINK